jgi:hypothetical protein
MPLTIRQALREDIPHLCHLMKELSGHEIDVSLKSGHGEQGDYNKLNYNWFEVSNHEKENI